jgi:hypothetical protein
MALSAFTVAGMVVSNNKVALITEKGGKFVIATTMLAHAVSYLHHGLGLFAR